MEMQEQKTRIKERKKNNDIKYTQAGTHSHSSTEQALAPLSPKVYTHVSKCTHAIGAPNSERRKCRDSKLA